MTQYPLKMALLYGIQKLVNVWKSKDIFFILLHTRINDIFCKLLLKHVISQTRIYNLQKRKSLLLISSWDVPVLRFGEMIINSL